MTRRKDSFGYGVTLTPVVERMVDAGVAIQADAPEKLDFLHAVLCQIGMPRCSHVVRC